MFKYEGANGHARFQRRGNIPRTWTIVMSVRAVTADRDCKSRSTSRGGGGGGEVTYSDLPGHYGFGTRQLGIPTFRGDADSCGGLSDGAPCCKTRRREKKCTCGAKSMVLGVLVWRFHSSVLDVASWMFARDMGKDLDLDMDERNI